MLIKLLAYNSTVSRIHQNNICLICMKPVNASSAAFHCPKCVNVFHRPHIVEWVKIKGSCPICGKKIHFSDF